MKEKIGKKIKVIFFFWREKDEKKKENDEFQKLCFYENSLFFSRLKSKERKGSDGCDKSDGQGTKDRAGR